MRRSAKKVNAFPRNPEVTDKKFRKSPACPHLGNTFIHSIGAEARCAVPRGVASWDATPLLTSLGCPSGEHVVCRPQPMQGH